MENAITTRRDVDSLLRQITQPVNAGHGINARARAYYRHPLKWLKSRFSLDLNGNYRENIVFLNSVPTLVKRYTEYFGLRLENRDRKIIGYHLRAGWDWNQTQYAEKESFNRNTLNHRYTANFDLTINDSWALASDFTYRIFAGDAFNERENLPIWSAEVLFYPLKDARFELKFSGTDLLNRNVGYSRRATDTYLQEERIASLTRYFLLTATWKLSKMTVQDGRNKFSGNKSSGGDRRRHRR